MKLHFARSPWYYIETRSYKRAACNSVGSLPTYLFFLLIITRICQLLPFFEIPRYFEPRKSRMSFLLKIESKLFAKKTLSPLPIFLIGLMHISSGPLPCIIAYSRRRLLCINGEYKFSIDSSGSGNSSTLKSTPALAAKKSSPKSVSLRFKRPDIFSFEILASELSSPSSEARRDLWSRKWCLLFPKIFSGTPALSKLLCFNSSY